MSDASVEGSRVSAGLLSSAVATASASQRSAHSPVLPPCGGKFTTCKAALAASLQFLPMQCVVALCQHRQDGEMCMLGLRS